MIPLKGNWKDSPKSLQPPEFTYEVVNGVITKNLGALTNENGTAEHSVSYNALNYRQVGIFNAKYGDKIVLSIGPDDLSKIGIIKANGLYIEKLSAPLGFNQDFPIDLESYYNYKGELVIVITDNNQTPKHINLDAITLPLNLNDIQLYDYFTQPQCIAAVNDSGGNLPSGAYFPFFGYENDESTTPYTLIEKPIFITKSVFSEGFDKYEGCKPGTITTKAIQLTVNNVDTNFKKIIVGFISKIDGVLTAYTIGKISISGSTLTASYTGSEVISPITLGEVLTSTSSFEKIKHLTQVNGVLYGAGITESSPVNFQKWSNLIKLKWTSKLINTNSLEESYKVNKQNNIEKGFWHEEVYAFYIKLKIKGRGFSEAFLISGRAPEGDETKTYLELGSTGPQKTISPNAKVYQVDDTSGPSGKFGYWENEDEFYPYTDDYAPVNGSEDLRGKKVRHHRFPSIRVRREAISDPAYGKYKLDALGIDILEFPVLPVELSSIIEGYEIFYARRDANNSTVQGQSMLLFNHNDAKNADGKAHWGGGNWDMSVREQITGGNPIPHYYLNNNRARFNSFDLMFDKPIISPTYLSNQYKMKSNVIGIMNDITITTAIWVSYFENGSTAISAITADKDKFIKMNSFRYIPANSNPGDYVNIIGEEAAVGILEGDVTGLRPTPIQTLIRADFQNVPVGVTEEQSFLVNLMAYRTNIYNSFELQTLVSTGTYLKITDTNRAIWGGDCNIGPYSFVTFSPKTSANESNPGGEGQGVSDGPTRAVKVLRTYICESNNNLTLRHEIDGQKDTFYWPKQIVTTNSAWFIDMSRITNPNRLAYNKDYTSLNDLNASIIFNSKNKFIAEDPYKIIRSKIPNAEERESSWKTFLANDYYIIPKDKGFITNIQGAGKDLFINCEFTLLKTQGSEELATNSFKVVLGTGNIFERPPIEMVLEKDGYAGCQHKFSCLLTRFGYFFLDQDSKKVFLATSESVKDITPGLRSFFEEKLKATGDNPYRSKGYAVAWDEEMRRIILSSKEMGFTRSFSAETRSEVNEMGSWISKHTYYPDFLIGDRNSLYALSNGKIHKHNIKGVKGIYYGGSIQPFIVVIIFREPQNQITVTNVTWRTNVILDEVNLKDASFNSILLWNSYQSTETISLVPYDKTKLIEDNFDQSNIRRIKNEWNFNKIRNCLKQGQFKFINDIDLVPDTTDVNQDFNMKKPLSDDYVVVKLLFSNQKISNLQAEIQLLELNVNNNNVAR